MTATLLETWRTSAACLGADLSMFCPDDDLTGVQQGRLMGLAKDVCARCGVVDACLSWALQVGDTASVLGGTTPEERRRIAVQRGIVRPATHGTAGAYLTCRAGDGGGRCDGCRAAHNRAVASWRQRRRTAPATRRSGLVVPVRVLDVPAGRGLHRAYPGQLAWTWEAA